MEGFLRRYKIYRLGITDNVLSVDDMKIIECLNNKLNFCKYDEETFGYEDNNTGEIIICYNIIRKKYNVKYKFLTQSGIGDFSGFSLDSAEDLIKYWMLDIYGLDLSDFTHNLS